MKNRYEEGSISWGLLDAAEKIEQEPQSGDRQAEATKQLAVALYRVGAALTENLRFIGAEVSGVAANIDNKS
jgi:hypothetical protein